MCGGGGVGKDESGGVISIQVSIRAFQRDF